MSIIKIAIVNDTIRTVINTTKYEEAEVPSGVGVLKYTSTLPWMGSGVLYGFRSLDPLVRDIPGHCEVINEETGLITLNETAMRIEVKEQHKAAVNTASDAIRDGWLLCDTDPAPGEPALNKSFLGSSENRALLTGKQNVIQRKTAEVIAEFTTLWVKTGKGDNDEYSILPSEVEPMYDAVEFTTQALVNCYIEVKNMIISDFNDPLMSLEEFESQNYVTDVYRFNDVFEAMIADTKIYAQPEDQPSAL